MCVFLILFVAEKSSKPTSCIKHINSSKSQKEKKKGQPIDSLDLVWASCKDFAMETMQSWRQQLCVTSNQMSIFSLCFGIILSVSLYPLPPE